MTASIKAGFSPVRSASCFISSQNLGNAEQACGAFVSFGSLLAERVHAPKTKNEANVTARQFVTKLLRARNSDAASPSMNQRRRIHPSQERAMVAPRPFRRQHFEPRERRVGRAPPA